MGFRDNPIRALHTEPGIGSQNEFHLATVPLISRVASIVGEFRPADSHAIKRESAHTRTCEPLNLEPNLNTNGEEGTRKREPPQADLKVRLYFRLGL